MIRHTVRRLETLRTALKLSSYLEIGVANGHTFNAVGFERKDAVDPLFRFKTDEFATDSVRFFEMPSDEFFVNHAGKSVYDVIFLDGLHTFEQTFRDFCAALSLSHAKTVWLIDDVIPNDMFSAHPDQREALRARSDAGLESRAWHGDVFKVVYAIHDFFPNLTFRTINTRGNPQTVVWRKARPDFRPVFNNLETISRLDYYAMQKTMDVFAAGPEDEILQEVIADLSGTV